MQAGEAVIRVILTALTLFFATQAGADEEFWACEAFKSVGDGSVAGSPFLMHGQKTEYKWRNAKWKRDHSIKYIAKGSEADIYVENGKTLNKKAYYLKFFSGGRLVIKSFDWFLPPFQTNCYKQ